MMRVMSMYDRGGRKPKGWGAEDWIANTPLYCGKVLAIHGGKRTSWHRHELKDETFLVVQGSLKLLAGTTDNISEAREFVMREGDSFHVPVGTRHRLEALTDCLVVEFSTEHFETDSIRIIPGD